MAGPIHDVLLRIIGDEDDARESLEKMGAELEAFSRIHAEADVELNTDEAHVRLDEMKAALVDLGNTNTDPNIDVDIAGAIAQIEALQAELEALDHESVTVDVDVQRGIAEQLLAVTRNVNSLRKASSLASGEAKSFLQRIADSAVSFGPFTTQLRTAIPIAAALAGVITALAGAVAALVASLTAAVGGLVALGIAAGGVISTGILAAIVAVARFAKQAEKPGTAAHAMVQAFGEVKDAIAKLGPVVDPIFRSLAGLLRIVAGLLLKLKPALRVFGKAAASAFGPLKDALEDPALVHGLKQLIRLSGDALRPSIRIATALWRIFVNIARAALPELVKLLRSAARGLEGLATASDNMALMRGIIGVLVRNLRLWLSLIKEIGRLFLNFVAAALPAGEDFVGFLRDGVKQLADWVKANPDRIQKFFDDVLPLAKSLVGFVAKLVLAFIQLGELAAPVIKPIVDGFNLALDAINFILDKLNTLPAIIRQVVSVAALLLLPFGKAKLAVAALISVFGIFKNIATGAFNAVKRIASGFVEAIKRGWETLKQKTVEAWHTITGTVREAWNIIKRAATGAVNAVRGAVVAAWEKIKSVTHTVFSALGSFIDGIWNGIKTAITAPVRIAAQVVERVWGAIKTAASDAFHAVKTAIVNAFNSVIDFLKSLPGRMIDFGEDIARGIADGIKNGAGWIFDAMKDAVLGPVGWAADKLGIGSPSKVMHEYGLAVAQGFANGINAMHKQVQRAFGRMASAGMDSLALAGAGAARAAGGAQSGVRTHTEQNNQFTIPVTVPGGGAPDPQAWVAAIDRRLRQRGLSLA